MIDNIYPWQQNQWSHITELLTQKRLPHALLLNGTKDLGKRTFAMALARRLLCLTVLDSACGECQGCHLMQARTHPDFYLIEPIDKSKIIKIEQVRELVDSLGHTPQLGGFQVVMIQPAEAMNIASANALLKTLEEPPGNIIFLLISHQLSRISATIRSRCQRLDFYMPDASQALTWLKAQQISTSYQPEILLRLAEGLPLRALLLTQDNRLSDYQRIIAHFLDVRLLTLDPLEAAGDLLSVMPEHIFNALWSLIMDMVHLRLIKSRQTIINIDQLDKLQTISHQIQLSHLFSFLDTLLLFRQKNDSKIAINQQLLLEALFIEWQSLR